MRCRKVIIDPFHRWKIGRKAQREHPQHVAVIPETVIRFGFAHLLIIGAESKHGDSQGKEDGFKLQITAEVEGIFRY